MKVTPVNKKFGKHKPGDVFDFPDKPARVSISLGKLAAVVAADEEISPRTGRPKRQYRRRDMAAEG
jgi:hypothetical protein